MNKINLADKFNLFDDLWSPKIIAESNGQLVKLAKGKGELVWHSHDNEDELFLVLKGTLIIKLKDKDITLNKGEIFVVPKGVEHCPVANEETHFLMIEPASTKHTGDTDSKQTKSLDEQNYI